MTESTRGRNRAEVPDRAEAGGAEVRLGGRRTEMGQVQR
jgi:hypothetical protein